ncbi:unnamed protein product [Arabidopsis lyrata]|nr:unnamed protein product [Arabidopsis lyrata]
MVDRGKSKQACSFKGFSERLKEDRISQLPDPLICQILSHLPTKDSVKTSVLSTRWTSLWLWVPCLELAHWDFPDSNAFRSFGDMFFDSTRASFINKVKLTIDETMFKEDVDDELIPLISCHGLMLQLSVILDDVEFVSLPCLKTLHLKYIYYREEASFERLVSCCPILEKLKIVVSEFVIDAPRIRFLSISDKIESYLLDDVDCSKAKVDISLPFGLDDVNEANISLRSSSSIHSFLPGISKVRDLTICQDVFKLICEYLKKEPLPQFGYMSRLRVTLHVSDLNMLPTFLESCPNLKSLILVWNSNSKKMYHEELRQFNFSAVPECLLSSLEFVDFKTGISGHHGEQKLVMYFLANSTILKKLTLRLNYYCTNEKLFVKDVLKFPRRSTTCQVVIY